MEDGSKKEIRSLSTRKDAVGGVKGFFDDVKDQYIQVMFEDKSYVCLTLESLEELA